MSRLMSQNPQCKAGYKTTHEKAMFYVSHIKKILDGEECSETKLNNARINVNVLHDLLVVRESDW